MVQSIVACDGSTEQIIVRALRLPRALTALFVGANLAVAGVLMQGITGVTAGAALSAASVLMLYPNLPVMALPLVAFVGGLLASLLVYLLAYKGGAAPARLALVGIAVTTLCGSGIKFLITRYPVEVNVALVWLTGSLWGRDWTYVAVIVPWILVLIPSTIIFARRLDILALGDDIAVELGESVERIRWLALLLGVALGAAAVAVSGTIGFVGLIAPHIARRLVGPRHIVVVPASALVGTFLVLLADALGRGLAPPLEIPAGLITSLVGAPYFLYLLARKGG